MTKGGIAAEVGVVFFVCESGREKLLHNAKRDEQLEGFVNEWCESKMLVEGGSLFVFGVNDHCNATDGFCGGYILPERGNEKSLPELPALVAGVDCEPAEPYGGGYFLASLGGRRDASTSHMPMVK